MSGQSDIFEAVKVWAAAAWADGVIAEEERLALGAIISVAKLSDEQKATAQGWLDKKVDLADIAVGELSDDNKSNIYAAACGVIAIDKDVVAAESTFLARLRETLGIDEATAKSIRDQAGVDRS